MSTDDPLFAAMASSGIFSSDDLGTEQKVVENLLNKEKMEVENSSHINSAVAENDDQCTAEDEEKNSSEEENSSQKTSPILEGNDIQSVNDVKMSSDPGFAATTRTLETKSEIGDLTVSGIKSDTINTASENVLKSPQRTVTLKRPHDFDEQPSSDPLALKSSDLLVDAQPSYKIVKKIVNLKDPSKPVKFVPLSNHPEFARTRQFAQTQTRKTYRELQPDVLHNMLSLGILRRLFQGGVMENEQFVVQITNIQENGFVATISDGVYSTDKCLIGQAVKTIKFFPNPIIRLVQWSLQNVFINKERRKILRVEKLVVVKNCKDIPKLGSPQALVMKTKLGRQRTLTEVTTTNPPVIPSLPVRIVKKKVVEMPDPPKPKIRTVWRLREGVAEVEKVQDINEEKSFDFDTVHTVNKVNTVTKDSWMTVLCYLKEVDVASDVDREKVIESFCRDIVSKYEVDSKYDNKYGCSECGVFRCRQLRQMVSHVQLTHLPSFPGYRCPQCCSTVRGLVEFERHVKLHHVYSSRTSMNYQNYPPSNSQVLQQIGEEEAFPGPVKWSGPLGKYIGDNKRLKVENEAALSAITTDNIAKAAAGILGSMDNHFMFLENQEQVLVINSNTDPAEDKQEKDKEKNQEDEKLSDNNTDGPKDVNWSEVIDKKIMMRDLSFFCTDCGFSSAEMDALLDHIQRLHVTRFPGYGCDQCGQRFQFLVTFRHHATHDHGRSISIEASYSRILSAEEYNKANKNSTNSLNLPQSKSYELDSWIGRDTGVTEKSADLRSSMKMVNGQWIKMDSTTSSVLKIPQSQLAELINKRCSQGDSAYKAMVKKAVILKSPPDLASKEPAVLPKFRLLPSPKLFNAARNV